MFKYLKYNELRPFVVFQRLISRVCDTVAGGFCIKDLVCDSSDCIPNSILIFVTKWKTHDRIRN